MDKRFYPIQGTAAERLLNLTLERCSGKKCQMHWLDPGFVIHSEEELDSLVSMILDAKLLEVTK